MHHTSATLSFYNLTITNNNNPMIIFRRIINKNKRSFYDFNLNSRILAQTSYTLVCNYQLTSLNLSKNF